MAMKSMPSPNWNDRPEGSEVDLVVLHYTGMQTAEAALARLCDETAEVSAHYMIDEDGSVLSLVPEEKRAWHAGVSWWRGQNNVNHTSIGIELVNPGHEFGYRDFPAVQIDSLLELLSGIKKRWNIPFDAYVGHSDVAPGRKCDPGERFPWGTLAKEEFGVVSAVKGDNTARISLSVDDGLMLNKELAIIGYDTKDMDAPGFVDEGVVRSFQMHWRPSGITGTIDRGTRDVLQDLSTRLQRGYFT